jgi:hypothetical protein
VSELFVLKEDLTAMSSDIGKQTLFWDGSGKCRLFQLMYGGASCAFSDLHLRDGYFRGDFPIFVPWRKHLSCYWSLISLRHSNDDMREGILHMSREIFKGENRAHREAALEVLRCEKSPSHLVM